MKSINTKLLKPFYCVYSTNKETDETAKRGFLPNWHFLRLTRGNTLCGASVCVCLRVTGIRQHRVN